ncbi:MAG: redoxin domain-containing protein [Nitriliruptorales bacterium]|nr:redoxin domain-containing protein [Nitriliruptorales bacterium]
MWRGRLGFALLALLLAGCSLLPAAGSEEPVVVFAPDERVGAPEIAGETIKGEPLALADFDGPVVLNFWASWCGPCRTEAPHLNAVETAYADRGVSVLGVNTKDPNLVNARTFAQDNGLVFESWYDPEQAIAAQFGASGPRGLPTTIVLDAQHRVAARYYGAITGATLGSRLDELLAEGA